MTPVAAAQESPVWIESDDEHVFGVVTHPLEANGTGVLLLPGGGWMPSTMRNRMYVQLARRLAARGVTALRIDYRGVGESTGATPFFDFARPARSDVDGAVDILEHLGCERLIVIGSCFGGRTALSSLADHPRLAGMVLSAVPVEDYGGASQSLKWHARRALSKQTFKHLRARYPKYLRIIRRKAMGVFRPGVARESAQASPDYTQPLLGLVERGVPCLVLHGTEDRHFPAFDRFLQETAGERLRAAASLTVDLFQGELHGELTVAAQEFAAGHIEDFVAALLPEDGRTVHESSVT